MLAYTQIQKIKYEMKEIMTEFQHKKHNIFITGGSGYIGQSLIPKLIQRNHSVYCLVREKSLYKLPDGCIPIIGNALDNKSYIDKVVNSDTFIHMVGVPHPSPAKKELFRKIDLVSLEQSLDAAINSNISNFIYISVAHPAPIMKEYINVRSKCEEMIISSGIRTVILRPWYVLGPTHRWPYLLLPLYKLLETIPSSSETARRLGMVTLPQMINAMVYAVENTNGIKIKIMEVPQIRNIYFDKK